MIEIAIERLIEKRDQREWTYADFDDGYTNGVDDAISVLTELLIDGNAISGPSKERLLALADKMLVLGSPQSSKELLDMAEKFGVD